MNKIRYCIPTLNRFDHLQKAVIAANTGTQKPDEIIIIDNSGNGGSIPVMQPLLQRYMNIYILPQTYNLGVSKSWNTFMTMYPDDMVIIANDDVFVHTHAIENMVRERRFTSDTTILTGASNSGNMFSLFTITHKAFEHIGLFDEKFYPGYYEDNDYARRALLLGYKLVALDNVTYDHIGSATIAAYDEQRKRDHHSEFSRLGQYYRDKWGGMPGQEVYTIPFNK